MRNLKKWNWINFAMVGLMLLQIMVLPACAVTDKAEETAAATEITAEVTEVQEPAPVEPLEEVVLPEDLPEVTLEAVVVEVEETTEPEEEPEEETEEEEEKITIDTVPLYFQTDYPDIMYANGTIESSGCSVTSLAMVASYMTDHVYLPDELAHYFGGSAENNIARLEAGSDAMELAYEKVENFHKALEALREGKVVIALMNGSSIFTTSQHFIVLTGINEDGKIMVNDPYQPNYSHWMLKKAFREGFEAGDISCGFSGAWAYDKSAMPEEPFLYKEELPDYSNPRYPEIKLSYEEIRLLASMVWVEARGESDEGQQAVAEVVLNRLAADNFPDTLKGVIYAENQFRSVPYLDEAEPAQAQFEAIERAIYGPHVLPEDVVFFATYKTNENVWGQIGGHYFCYQW